MASSSSMKMIDGAASFALANRSRTRDAPTPTIASMNSDAAIEKNAAMGLARRPRGRAASCRFPAGRRAARRAGCGPELHVLVGVAQEVDDLGELGLGLVDTGDVGEGDHDLLSDRRDAPASAEVAEEPRLPALRRVPREEHEQADEQQRRSEAEAASSRSVTGPVVGDLALTSTPFDRRRFVRLALSQNDGTRSRTASSAWPTIAWRIPQLVLEHALDRVALSTRSTSPRPRRPATGSTG